MNLIDQSTKDLVRNRILKINASSTPLWGQMNASQMLSHVQGQIEICNGTKPAKDRSNIITRTIAKWIGLYLPIPLPKNLNTFKEINPNFEVLTVHNDLETAKENLISSLKTIDKNKNYWHPIFGNLNDTELGKLTYVHLDHHLRQFGV